MLYSENLTTINFNYGFFWFSTLLPTI